MQRFMRSKKPGTAGDFEKAYSYFAEHYVFESVASGESTKGKAALKALMGGLLQAFPDLKFEGKNIFVYLALLKEQQLLYFPANNGELSTIVNVQQKKIP